MRVSRLLVLLCLGLLLALGTVACGDDGEDGSTTTQENEPQEDAPEGEETGAPSREIVASNFAFQPSEIEVESDSDVTMTFTNEDDTAHSFTSEELGVDVVVEGGSSGEVAFTAPESGSVDFVCKFHSSMTGTVAVEGGADAGGNTDDTDDVDY